MKEQHGKWICLDWYDGPLLEIAVVTFPDSPAPGPLIEAKTYGFESEDGHVGYDGAVVPMTHVRFTRESLVAMLDLLDGKPVKGFFDE